MSDVEKFQQMCKAVKIIVKYSHMPIDTVTKKLIGICINKKEAQRISKILSDMAGGSNGSK